MPAMLRLLGKATKIAYKILGKPDNLKEHKTIKDRKIDRRLSFEETYRVR
jgi:hypothetical protein